MPKQITMTKEIHEKNLYEWRKASKQHETELHQKDISIGLYAKEIVQLKDEIKELQNKIRRFELKKDYDLELKKFVKRKENENKEKSFSYKFKEFWTMIYEKINLKKKKK